MGSSLFQRVMVKILSWWLEHHKKFNNSQFGFRRNRSCTDNLSILTTDDLNDFEKGNEVSAMFLDIKGAYDNVLPDLLIDNLKNLGLPGNLLSFIYNLISSRKLHAKYGDFEEVGWTSKGLLQGSVLSPLLYALYLNIKEIANHGCKILEFADDVVIYTSNENTQIGINNLERDTNNVNSYLEMKGLSLAANKCIFMVFNKCSGQGGLWDINLDSNVITSSRIVKLFGRWLSSNFEWEKQISSIEAKCQTPLKILSCIRSTWQGADPIVLIRLYKALIRSRIEYCGFLFHKLTKQQAISSAVTRGGQEGQLPRAQCKGGRT
ncbi:uncharacterized protein LOC122854972 [Aphidius gifuensis]|uniref:uncharacterized protein LOC122854972 n=1 Tax=Aphidius gifuensis TaxID=684658 RepID=UPI001CDCEFC2|nr:uncharacterized protein LOC122854972 [Aphidius gifuensis]